LKFKLSKTKMSLQHHQTFEENKENFDYMTQKWTPAFKHEPIADIRSPLRDITDDVVPKKKSKPTSIMLNLFTEKKTPLNKMR